VHPAESRLILAEIGRERCDDPSTRFAPSAGRGLGDFGGHRIGEARRIGEILEVLGEAGHDHYRVRWDDDHESVFYPSSDSTIQKAAPRKKRR
jgi:Domain of unknown function (DUF1918)